MRLVYFILAGGKTRRVKIGSGFSPEARLDKIRLMSPVPVRIVATIANESAQALENALQRHFVAARVRGEWFTLTDELRAFIRAVLAGTQKLAPVFSSAAQLGPSFYDFKKLARKAA